jgi:hypothetical protein
LDLRVSSGIAAVQREALFGEEVVFLKEEGLLGGATTGAGGVLATSRRPGGKGKLVVAIT